MIDLVKLSSFVSAARYLSKKDTNYRFFLRRSEDEVLYVCEHFESGKIWMIGLKLRNSMLPKRFIAAASARLNRERLE